MITVLFSSAGRRVALMETFREDARTLGESIRIVATDVEPEWSPACLRADQAFKVPACASADFIPALLEICVKTGVRLLVPTIDTELQILADNQGLFAEKGVHIAVSTPELIRIVRDKRATADWLQSHGLKAPKSGTIQQVLAQPAHWTWPVVLKPLAGSGSVQVQIVRTLDELALAASQREDYVAQEFTSGREFTTHLFFNRDGQLRCAVPHWRKEVRSGEVSKAITARRPDLMALAEKVASFLPGPRGAICFQAIVPEQGEPVIHDVNARFGGGYPLIHHAGAPFGKWLISEALGRPSGAKNDWQDGVAMLRYDAAVFQSAAQSPLT